MPEIWEGKRYKLVKSENFEEYMKALGVGFMMRKIGNTVSPTVELTKEEDTYTLTTSSTFKTSVLKFELDKEFEEETVDGRKVPCIMTLNENKLVQEQKGDKPSTIIREFVDNQLITTLEIGDIKCVRVYETCA